MREGVGSRGVWRGGLWWRRRVWGRWWIRRRRVCRSPSRCTCILLYVSSCFCMCVLILLHVSSYSYMCVLMHYSYMSTYSYCVPLFVSSYSCMCPHTPVCPHTPIYVSSYSDIYLIILLNVCPHTSTCVSSYSLYVSSYSYICVLSVWRRRRTSAACRPTSWGLWWGVWWWWRRVWRGRRWLPFRCAFSFFFLFVLCCVSCVS